MCSFHFEAAGRNTRRNIETIHSLGMKAGVAINPDVPVEKLFPYIGKADYFLLMSVFAGFGGQKFIYESLDRASRLRDELAKRGYEFDKVVVIESEAEIDEDLICQKAVEENAVIAFTAHGVLGTRARELLRRARYWVVPGRRPEEDGGTFRGYQFCDRFVRWHYRAPESERAARHGEHMEKMHDIVREKGQATRRVYFTDQVVNRFAERIGMSRQRVASRFLDDGVIDWLARSADSVKPPVCREKESIFRGKITAAVDALEFYYRAIEGRFPTEGRGK